MHLFLIAFSFYLLNVYGFYYFPLKFCSGEVLLDGENIKNLKLEWLRSQIGLVTQEPALLSLSIRENIAYGRDASVDQIEEAAKIAHAHSFISSLDKGYDTQVYLHSKMSMYFELLDSTKCSYYEILAHCRWEELASH